MATPTRNSALPPGCWPRLLSADKAAAYTDHGTTTFLKLVDENMMPKPIPGLKRRRWDIRDLDLYIDGLKGEAVDSADTDIWSDVG